MVAEFPKREHYSNSKLVLDKNIIKGLTRVKEEKKEIMDNLLTIQRQCESFWSENETRRKFKDIREKLNKNIHTIIPNTEKRYEDNIFKKKLVRGECEACNHNRSLDQAHIIKKSVFNKYYSRWIFLKYHPINITFLCNDCHKMFDGHCKDNRNNNITLSKGKLHRIDTNVHKRLKNIKRHIKLDEKFLAKYKYNFDIFKTQKEKMLRKLLNTL